MSSIRGQLKAGDSKTSLTIAIKTTSKTLLKGTKDAAYLKPVSWLTLICCWLALVGACRQAKCFDVNQLQLDGWPSENDELGRSIQPMKRRLWADGELGLQSARQQSNTRTSAEIYLLEDKDYPRSLFENYSASVGQVSGITVLPWDDVVIFHRAGRQWTADTQMPALPLGYNDQKAAAVRSLEQRLLKNNTLMILDRELGNEIISFGSDLFYMPHSVASDAQGNLWVSDTGRHQVMRLPTGRLQVGRARADGGRTRAKLADNTTQVLWPDLVLGEAFVPGRDADHLCQPAEIAVSSDGRLVFVADGYCNQRVMVYAGDTGQFVASFGQAQQMRVVHSLVLMEEHNLVCVADRENARILCYQAGLDGDLESLGRLRLELSYPIGRVYALASVSRDHLLVSSSQFNQSNRYDLAIVNPITRELKLVWTSSDLLEPHSLARTFDRSLAYAADLSRDAFKKVFKFQIIAKPAE